PGRPDAGLAAGPARRTPGPNPPAAGTRSVPPEEDALRNGHRRALPVPDAPISDSPPDPESLDTTSARPGPVLPKQSGPKADDPIRTASRSLRTRSKDARTGATPGTITPEADLALASDEDCKTSSGTTPTDSSEVAGPHDPGPAIGLSHVASAPAADGRARVEFRDAAAILAAQGRRVVNEPTGRPGTSRKTATYGFPTDPALPAQWSVPAWFALSTAGSAAVVALGVGLMLAVGWTSANLSAGLAARAALRSDDAKPVMLDPAERAETRWWKTTAGQLALWSAAIERSPDAATRVDEVRDALDAARRSAPLESSTRYAWAQTIDGWETPSSVAAMGLSRDAAALTLTGRTLKRAGKAEAALRAYRAALELAASSDASRLAPPAFDDDQQVRRFRLPHEAIVGGVIRDMIEAGDWSFAAWSSALPPRAVVRLAAARILREKGNTDAERALGLVLADDLTSPDSPTLAAEELAAKAEALALTERRREAADRYREAIAMVEDDATQRRWRLALAEVLTPLGESSERATLLEAAKGSDPTDDVTRKAVEAQQFAGLK
ncbi:MAG TPA: hypothetical protein VGH33_04775, partial [Isosphaeraceae bacterium]